MVTLRKEQHKLAKFAAPSQPSRVYQKRGRKSVFFCEGHDWIIDRRDPVAQELIRLVQEAKLKTKMHEHKGTYRMRAWLIPENAAEEPTNPFGRQGA